VIFRKRISQLGHDIKAFDFLNGFRGMLKRSAQDDFAKEVAGYHGLRYAALVSSGAAALYVILETLKKKSKRRKVIIPAYTAPIVVLPILKAKLKAVLCDITLDDFNMDFGKARSICDEDTLCVMPTHLFGIAAKGIEKTENGLCGAYLVEDCAQAMGGRLGNEKLGTLSDVSFVSFNRGKNLPAYGGGAVLTDSEEIFSGVLEEIRGLKEAPLGFKTFIPIKFLAFSLAVRPALFSALYPFISAFKDEKVPDSFNLFRFTAFQSGAGISLLERFEDACRRRRDNAEFLIGSLKGIGCLKLPEIPERARCAVNRLPVFIEDEFEREKIRKALEKAGVDTSSMYGRPIHLIFDLGYKKGDFPYAELFSKAALTLPVHPLLDEKDLDMIVKTIKDALS